MKLCTKCDNLQPDNAFDSRGTEGAVVSRCKLCSHVDAKKATGIDSSSISKACRGLQAQAGGFYWEYV